MNNSSIRVYDFLKDNPSWTKVVIDNKVYYNDDEVIFDNLTNNDEILNKHVHTAFVEVVHFHHYSISIITEDE